MTVLYRVDLPYGCAGVIVREGRVVEAAPLLAWSVGMTLTGLIGWVERRGGECHAVKEWDDEEKHEPAGLAAGDSAAHDAGADGRAGRGQERSDARGEEASVRGRGNG